MSSSPTGGVDVSDTSNSTTQGQLHVGLLVLCCCNARVQAGSERNSNCANEAFRFASTRSSSTWNNELKMKRKKQHHRHRINQQIMLVAALWLAQAVGAVGARGRSQTVGHFVI